MSLVTHGSIPYPFAIQPDRLIVENLDGTLDGKIEYVAEKRYEMYLPQIGDTHPDDRRLEVHTREITYARNKLINCTCHFRGLVDDPTEPTISYIGSPDRERIERHPDFATFAGSDAATAKNGADWYKLDPKAKRDSFHGFTDATVKEFHLVEYYLKASTQITLTWWQTRVPEVDRIRIVPPSDLKPFKSPNSVKNYLLLDSPYRQVGSFFQISKIYLGSDETGWSATIYPTPSRIPPA